MVRFVSNSKRWILKSTPLFSFFFQVVLKSKNGVLVGMSVKLGLTKSSLLICSGTKVAELALAQISQWGVAGTAIVLQGEEGGSQVEYLFETDEAEFIGEVVDGKTVRLVAEMAV